MPLIFGDPNNDTLPCNGPVIVNGYQGDAMFRSCQSFSTISERLAQSLYKHPEVNDVGRKYSIVYPKIEIGNGPKKRSFIFPARIYEESVNLLQKTGYTYAEERPSRNPIEVILGSEFLDQVGYISPMDKILEKGQDRPLRLEIIGNRLKLSFGSEPRKATKADKSEKMIEIVDDDSEHPIPLLPPGVGAKIGMGTLAELMNELGIDTNINTFSKFGIENIPYGSLRKFVKDYTNCDYLKDPDNRVILLFDMDCFEVQVHEKEWMRGRPRVVINSSNRIVAVSYEAKMIGVNRQKTPYLSDARRMCPDIISIQIPSKAGQAGVRPRPDTRIARAATERITTAMKSALSKYPKDLTIFKFSSNDEFYVDVTGLVNFFEEQNKKINKPLVEKISHDKLWPNTLLYNGPVKGIPQSGYLPNRLTTLRKKKSFSGLETQEIRLIFGSTIANAIVQEILKQTNYQSSVGIGSKMLISKIASGLHKPGSVTILAPSGFPKFAEFIKMDDIPGLGGKIGQRINEIFGIQTMSQLSQLKEQELANLRTTGAASAKPLGVEKAKEILNKAHGLCDIPVTPQTCFATCGVNSNVGGKRYEQADIWDFLTQLLDELLEKLDFEKVINLRTPSKLNVKIEIQNGTNKNAFLPLSPQEDVFKISLFDFFPDKLEWNNIWKVETISIVATY